MVVVVGLRMRRRRVRVVVRLPPSVGPAAAESPATEARVGAGSLVLPKFPSIPRNLLRRHQKLLLFLLLFLSSVCATASQSHPKPRNFHVWGKATPTDSWCSEFRVCKPGDRQIYVGFSIFLPFFRWFFFFPRVVAGEGMKEGEERKENLGLGESEMIRDNGEKKRVP